jgi:glycosyltransferase involved in cell wall biosynthesis
MTAPGESQGVRFNGDRLLNRFWDYPRWLRKQRDAFQLFHLADHSYAQLALELPPERTIVTCHDVDTFRGLWEKENAPSGIYRLFARRTLKGLQRAARVVCVSQATADEILAHNLARPERLHVVYQSVHPVFKQEPEAAAETEAARLLQPSGTIDLLHVSSTIARKRIDVLLRVLAGIRQMWPSARLVRVGGDFTPEQQQLVQTLGLAGAVRVLPPLTREVLAAVYRRASVVLFPSEREGFGWPVLEGLACGVPVVASDLPVLREVGGPAAEYAPVGDVAAWIQTVARLLRENAAPSGNRAGWPEVARQHAAQFNWHNYGQNLLGVYRELLV